MSNTGKERSILKTFQSALVYCIKGLVTLLVTGWSHQLTRHCNFKYITTKSTG